MLPSRLPTLALTRPHSSERELRIKKKKKKCSKRSKAATVTKKSVKQVAGVKRFDKEGKMIEPEPAPAASPKAVAIQPPPVVAADPPESTANPAKPSRAPPLPPGADAATPVLPYELPMRAL